MQCKPNWAETKERFEAWWKGDLTDAPLFSLVTTKDAPTAPLEEITPPASPTERFLDVERKLAGVRNQIKSCDYLTDAYPAADANLGPGSLARYLGSEPHFTEETLWFKEAGFDSWHDYPLAFDPNNKWFKIHTEMLRRLKEASGGEFLVNIPDLSENLDIIAALRGPQDMCIDLLDDPDIVEQRLIDLHNLYFKYYDAFYDITKGEDGSSSYTAFKIWGPGRTVLTHCDFSAMISPGQFRTFVIPTLKDQCDRMDFTMYHLDGEEAIKHVPALMEIPGLNALQWSPGDTNGDGYDERWFPLYDQVIGAGKSLWVQLGYGGDADGLVEKARRLTRRYGARALYIVCYGWVRDKEHIKTLLKAYAKGFK